MEHHDPFGFVGLTYDDVLLLPQLHTPAHGPGLREPSLQAAGCDTHPAARLRA